MNKTKEKKKTIYISAYIKKVNGKEVRVKEHYRLAPKQVIKV